MKIQLQRVNPKSADSYVAQIRQYAAETEQNRHNIVIRRFANLRFSNIENKPSRP